MSYDMDYYGGYGGYDAYGNEGYGEEYDYYGTGGYGGYEDYSGYEDYDSYYPAPVMPVYPPMRPRGAARGMMALPVCSVQFILLRNIFWLSMLGSGKLSYWVPTDLESYGKSERN